MADDDERQSSFINSALTQCQLVCKNWSELALKYKYSKITIDDPDHFSNLITVLSAAELLNPGIYLKELTIDFWEEVTIPHERLIKLLLLKCPNIEKLYLSPDAPGDIFGEIQKAFRRGACRRLKSIPEFTSNNATYAAIKQYLDALYCFRSSLEELVLEEGLVVNSNTRTCLQLQNLQGFPNLRSLTFNMELIKAVYKVGKLIESCPSIMELNLNWIPRTNTPENILLDDLRSITPCPTVKVLSLHAPVTKIILEYVMHAFADLDRFTCIQLLVEMKTPVTPLLISQIIYGYNFWFI
jgi:hypothetical protein